MSIQRVCDACGLPIAAADRAISGTFASLDATARGQGRGPQPDDAQVMDFHDTPKCWQRVFTAIQDAIKAAKAP